MGGFCGVVRRIELFKCRLVLSLAKGQAVLPSVRPEVSKDRAEVSKLCFKSGLRVFCQVPVPLCRRGGRLTFLCFAKET